MKRGEIRQINWPKMFRKKNHFGRIIHPFFLIESSESARFFQLFT